MPPETSNQLGEAAAKPPAATAPGPPTRAAQSDGAAKEQGVTTGSGPPSSRRRVIIGAIAVVALAVATYYGIPVVRRMLNTISTDDAYVNGHVTAVAARVPGQVMKVFVDDNYRVRKGNLLVQLDKEPYRIQVALKKATYENAEANLQVARRRVPRFGLAGAQQSLQARACDRGRR